MMDYNYREEIQDCIVTYYTEEIKQELMKKDKEEVFQEFYDKLFIADDVTGNGSGSYFFNTYKAEEALAHNWDLLQDALEEFGESDINPIEKGAEWCDVTIRCYLLGEVLQEVINEMSEELESMED